jgi:peptidoglycan/xylan/chitin deacetylase (PgdA/CDA1 family)
MFRACRRFPTTFQHAFRLPEKKLHALIPLITTLVLAGGLPAGHMLADSAEPAGSGKDTSRQVVITIDDLPKIMGNDSIESATEATAKIVASLARHQVPALGFVIGRQVFMDDQVDARLDLLRQWLAAGSDLGNHSFSHPSFNTTDPAAYQDDVMHGDLFPRRLMEENGRTLRYFRHPYNQTGPTAEIKSAFRTFMASRDYIIAPFTVEHADYAFNKIWVEARERGDEEGAGRIRAAYMEYLDTAFDFAEQLTLDTFGNPMPQIFLIHANDLNAVCLDAMLTRLQERGYDFVSMDQAMDHPSYTTPDDYVGTNGISWLHRWRHSLGLPDRLRDEPDPPTWILKAWQASQK